ncbi:MAG: hypothetical protein VKK62_04045 [Synechococcaceae cyanobacterium]|nr:hypothetical protein [Synechococcaceae cyanobacterium]
MAAVPTPKSPRRAAHFLLIPELLESPPNRAIITALINNGFEVDVYAPGLAPGLAYGGAVRTMPASYSWRWLIKQSWRFKWRRYACFSGTSEDPLAMIGVLAALHRRPCFVLADEIKSGSYSGNRSETWKKLCRWTNRLARFNIVNDNSRISLLRDYAGLAEHSPIIVYPGCFHKPPSTDSGERARVRREWGFPEDAFVVAASGGFNLTAGADWLVECLRSDQNLHAVIQPLGCDELSRFLLGQLGMGSRIHIESRRLSWEESWKSAVGMDVGLAIYNNPAPQFQAMGISSNRLCMFLAMGVPVIASRQASFEFLETYGCGVMVSDSQEFRQAVSTIRGQLKSMREGCKRCFEEYIMPPNRYANLAAAITTVLPVQQP